MQPLRGVRYASNWSSLLPYVSKAAQGAAPQPQLLSRPAMPAPNTHPGLKRASQLRLRRLQHV